MLSYVGQGSGGRCVHEAFYWHDPWFWPGFNPKFLKDWASVSVLGGFDQCCFSVSGFRTLSEQNVASEAAAGFRQLSEMVGPSLADLKCHITGHRSKISRRLGRKTTVQPVERSSPCASAMTWFHSVSPSGSEVWLLLWAASQVAVGPAGELCGASAFSKCSRHGHSKCVDWISFCFTLEIRNRCCLFFLRL